MVDLIALFTLAVPLAAALANGLSLFAGDRWLTWRQVQRITVGAAALSFAGSLALCALLIGDPTPRRVVVYDWITSGETSIQVAFLIDTLSVLMMTMVTGFAFVIGKFSINYMHREQGFTRYFAAYALFIFAMLVLVMGDNYAMLFVGWEAVGVCSYLLIGQYNDRLSAARASTEAFVANRVGDAGFLVGIFTLLEVFGTVDYAGVAARLHTADEGTLTFIALCLLLGAVGKSAQLPLGSWLAKAMEGPTPSSALIHAATMVTAGVYLLVRSQDLYNAAPNALLVVAIIGAATALYGAVVGQTVSDIKGLLATSTTTQLGFMFLACGLGAYAVAVFHMLAHAFMKSYLFLTAPSILHHLHGKLDPTRREPHLTLPTAYLLLTLGAAAMVTLSLAGTLLPESTAFIGEFGPAAWLLAAGGTMAIASAGYYAYSLTHKTFVEDDHEGHADPAANGHLPAGPVTWPLAIIALAAAAGFAMQIFPGGLEGSWFRALLGPIVREAAPAGSAGAAELRVVLTILLIAMVVYASLSAMFLGRFRAESAVPLARHRTAYAMALNRFWIDAFTRSAVVGTTCQIGRWLERFDRLVIDRFVALPDALSERLGAVVKWLDEHVVAAAERAPMSIARHTSATVDSVDRHGVGPSELAVRGLLVVLGRIGMGFERLIGGVETGLQAGLSSAARTALGFERTMARTFVAAAAIAVVVFVALMTVK